MKSRCKAGRISLVNVENSLDSKDIPVGHELKVLRDLQKVFGNRSEILAGREYIDKLDKKGVVLPFCIQSETCLSMSLKVLCNYFISLMKAEGDILIFIDTSEILLWGIALFKGKKKIISITYLQWDRYRKKYISPNPFKQFLVARGLKRLDGCIVTNKVYKPKVPYIRLPDYYITDEIRKYQNREKTEGCVCLGEIRGEKNVEGLVRVWKESSPDLLIAGSFQDRNMYRKLRSIRKRNIKIEDRNLPYDTYMEYLSTYKYVVLPYDSQYYSFRTSGVLLEGIFVGAVPIAPKSLLKREQIHGLGYDILSEIPELIRLYEQGEISVKNDLKKYQFERYQERVVQFVSQIGS